MWWWARWRSGAWPARLTAPQVSRCTCHPCPRYWRQSVCPPASHVSGGLGGSSGVARLINLSCVLFRGVLPAAADQPKAAAAGFGSGVLFGMVGSIVGASWLAVAAGLAVIGVQVGRGWVWLCCAVLLVVCAHHITSRPLVFVASHPTPCCKHVAPACRPTLPWAGSQLLSASPLRRSLVPACSGRRRAHSPPSLATASVEESRVLSMASMRAHS